MKKVLSILLVLCVAASLFAAVTVKAGFDFGTVYGVSKEDDSKQSMKFFTDGFGLDVAVIGDVASNLAVYGDVSVIWPIFYKQATITDGTSSDWYTVTKDADNPGPTEGGLKVHDLKVRSMAFRTGLLYTTNGQNFDLGIGGGLVYSISSAKIQPLKDIKSGTRLSVNMFGFSLYSTATYNVAKNVGVNLTINPDIYIYNQTKGYDIDSEGKETLVNDNYGFKFGYGINASVGVAFKF